MRQYVDEKGWPLKSATAVKNVKSKVTFYIMKSQLSQIILNDPKICKGLVHLCHESLTTEPEKMACSCLGPSLAANHFFGPCTVCSSAEHALETITS